MTMKYLRASLVFIAVLLLSFTISAKDREAPHAAVGTIAWADLPKQGQQTLALIKQGGPFPYPKDGVVFGNYEGSLPREARGYYHEYTVPTPGAHGRGARRIVAGGRPASLFYYTDDHYVSFKRILE